MRTTRVLDHDETTGITELYHFDPVTHGFTIETQQDISGLIELNKTIANDARGDWKGDLHHVAHIPLVVLMDLAQKNIVTPAGQVLDEKKFRAWLNSPENSHFRVKHGRV
jgi:hypothetical protein